MGSVRWIDDEVECNHVFEHKGKLGKYKWTFPNHHNVCYLKLIKEDSVLNQTVAKVYLWEGNIMYSIKVNLTEHPDYALIMNTVLLEQEFLRRDVANQIANRMEA